MSDLRTKIAETLAGLTNANVTPGPWSVERESDLYDSIYGVRHNHPVLVGEITNITDAAYIARCDPAFIRQLCEAALAGLEPSTPAPGRIEELEAALLFDLESAIITCRTIEDFLTIQKTVAALRSAKP